MHKNKLLNLAVVFVALLMVTTVGLAQEKTEALEQATFAVEGMTCGGCVGAVKVQLKRTEGVTEYEVSWEEGEAIVTFDPEVTDTDIIAAAITKSGFKATIKKG